MNVPDNLPTQRCESVIPAPVERTSQDGEYTLTSETEIRYESADARDVGRYLADFLDTSNSAEFALVEAAEPAPGAIWLSCSDGSVNGGEEGYHLRVDEDRVRIRATEAAGLFMGIQTLRQLLPPAVERETGESGPWPVPTVEIHDAPRFGYRGAHLDVARHFFDVDEVKTFVDWLALYKLNHLHLHLTDNEGWRIEIDGWPALTEDAAGTNVESGTGGYYTADDYREIVEYARARHITVVPELDIPAHAGAVVAAYPELSSGDPPASMPADSGTLDVHHDRTYEFVADVVETVANLTPGPYIHIGGDEADDLSAAEYRRFIERALPIVSEYDKTPVAWQEAAGGGAPTSTLIQYWKETDLELDDYDLLLSPRTHAYLNFRYDEETPPDGPETWDRRITSVETSYRWDPGSHVDGVSESAVRGVESALWSEKLATMDDVAFMGFPRLPGIAERGWSPPEETGWEGYRARLAAHASRWSALGIEYYESPGVLWL